MTIQEQDALILEMVEAGEKQRRRIARDVGERADDVLGYANLAAVEAVRSGVEIEHPTAYMMGIIRNSTIKMFAESAATTCVVDGMDAPDLAPSPLDNLISGEQHRAALAVIANAPAADREVLTRFYFEGQDKNSIEEAMSLTSTQFRLLKWRAKARVTGAVATAGEKLAA